jgi:hypothetical protein
MRSTVAALLLAGGTKQPIATTLWGSLAPPSSTLKLPSAAAWPHVLGSTPLPLVSAVTHS